MKPWAHDSTGRLVRPCIFCGALTNPSKEHLLARQWLNHFPDWSTNFSGDYAWLLDIDGSIQAIEKKRSPGAFRRTAPKGAVCNTCNNGWMSRLENATIPILLPVAQGKQVSLSVSDWQTTSLWLAKTAIVTEFMGEGPRASTLEFAKQLMHISPGESHAPGFTPPLIRRLRRRYSGTHVRSSIFGMYMKGHDCTGHYARATTVVIGSLALVTAHSSDPSLRDAIHWPTTWEQFGTLHQFTTDGRLSVTDVDSYEVAMQLNDWILDGLAGTITKRGTEPER